MQKKRVRSLPLRPLLREDVRPGDPRNPNRTNIFENFGVFFSNKKRPSTHHVYHAFHHKMTTKTPRSTTTIPQNPLQKHHSTTQEKKKTIRQIPKNPDKESKPASKQTPDSPMHSKGLALS